MLNKWYMENKRTEHIHTINWCGRRDVANRTSIFLSDGNIIAIIYMPLTLQPNSRMLILYI